TSPSWRLLRRARRRRSARLRPDLLTGSYPVATLDDNPLARLQPLRDDPQRSNALIDLDRPDVDRVVGLEDGHLVHSLNVLHGPLGNEDRILLYLDHGPYLRVLPRAQHVAWIGKDTSREHRAGAHVHLAIQNGRPPRRGVDAAIGKDQL